MNCDTAKSQVFPYMDGELAAELRDGLEAHLSVCRACRSFVGQETAFRDAYIVRLRPDPTPPHLREKINRLLSELVRVGVPRRKKRSVRWTYAATAAAVLSLFAIGVTLGMNLKSVLLRGDRLAELADASVDQHQRLVRGLLPPDIVGVSPKTTEAWFRKRLDFNVTLPELPTPNLTLLGGRISHLVNTEVAALAYQVDDKRVSLFIIPEEAFKKLDLNDSPRFKVLNHRGFDVIVWRHRGAGYTLVSEIGGRSCLVCHAPDARFNGRLESFGHL